MHKSRGRQGDPETDSDCGSGGACGCDQPKPSVFETVLADAVHRPDDQRNDADLYAQEEGFQQRLLQVELLIQPRENKHEHQPRQHETEAGQEAAQPTALHHPKVDAQLVRFRAGKDLVDGKQAG
jgi:hypothetical protein